MEHILEFVIAYRSHVIVIDIHSNISRYLERANNSPSDQVSVVHHPKKELVIMTVLFLALAKSTPNDDSKKVAKSGRD